MVEATSQFLPFHCCGIPYWVSYGGYYPVGPTWSQWTCTHIYFNSVSTSITFNHVLHKNKQLGHFSRIILDHLYHVCAFSDNLTMRQIGKTLAFVFLIFIIIVLVKENIEPFWISKTSVTFSSGSSLLFDPVGHPEKKTGELDSSIRKMWMLLSQLRPGCTRPLNCTIGCHTFPFQHSWWRCIHAHIGWNTFYDTHKDNALLVG